MISVPLMNALSNKENRPIYLAELRKAGADRVFVCPENPFGDRARLGAIMEQLSENIRYYEENGLDVGVWIGGLGHGGMLAHETGARVGDYTRIRGLGNGGEAEDSFCPLDPRFVSMYRAYLRAIAEVGAKMIMIDDDLRISMHGPVSVGCACPLHMAAFNERAAAAGAADHAFTREELASLLFTGKPSPLRQIWLGLMGSTLKDFCAALREELDSVDPTVRLGHCACLSTWDTDGVDSITLSRILAGRTKPFLRLIGAPYWNDLRAFGTTGLGAVIDLERMQLAWCKEYAPDIELMSEGDVYPRPRTAVPSSYLESYHQALAADGFADILKYMLDYSFDPAYETGYIRRHCLMRELRAAIADAFRGTEPAGIYVFEEMRKLADMDCTGWAEGPLSHRLTPAAANFAGALSLPISFVRSAYTKTALLVGENAKYAPADVCTMPLILDCAAARILTERGFDIGLNGAVPTDRPSAEIFQDGRRIAVDSPGRYYRMTPKEGAVTDSVYADGSPAVYRYERQEGGAVIVFAFDFESVDFAAQTAHCYCREEQIHRLLAGRIVAVKKEPGAYLITRRTPDKLVVGLWNFGRDLVYPEEIKLDGVYRSLTPIGAYSERVGFTLRGDAVTVSDMLPPYCFAGFIAEK